MTFRPLAFVVALSIAAGSRGEPRPVRLIAEAEDFTVEGDGWEVVPYGRNYFASTFAVTFLSRKACLGAPAQVPRPVVATQEIQIPRAGSYLVLARYEQPYDFAAEFTVEVEQAGEVVYRERYGRLSVPKIWAFNGHRRVPMQRYRWGGGDNIVWQHFDEVTLQRGRATLRLIAEAQLDGQTPHPRAARRHVDVLCLTDDGDGMAAQKKTRYLELDGWLVQAGDLFVRLTNLGDAPVAPVLAPHKHGQHSPYDVHVRDWPRLRVLRTGYAETATSYLLTGPRSRAVEKHLAPRLPPALFAHPPADAHLGPGERSGWVPLGHLLDALNDSVWELDLGVEARSTPSSRSSCAPRGSYSIGRRSTPRTTTTRFTTTRRSPPPSSAWPATRPRPQRMPATGCAPESTTRRTPTTWCRTCSTSGRSGAAPCRCRGARTTSGSCPSSACRRPAT